MPAQPPDTDDELMLRTAAGEEMAFRLLVERWEADVLSFLNHMLGSREEAEDLLQETFIRVFQQARRYQPQGMFRSWLLRIAGNQARSRLRRRRLLHWLPFDTAVRDVAATEPAPDLQLVRRQTEAAVRRAVARLSARQREALVLHRFQGLKYREVAEVMGTTVPGVESLIQRAMASLRTQLAPEGEQP